MYQWKDRVRFSELGENGHMTLEAMLNVFQDCTNFQSDALGVGQEYLASKQRAWLMNFWQVFVERYPVEREEYTAETRAWKFERFYGQRNFALYDGEGKCMVKANSVWFFVDSARMRPVRPDAEDVECYGVDEPLSMDYTTSRKIALPEEMKHGEAFSVWRAHLDVNHHVNNVQYVRMAAEYFPKNKEIYEVRAEYKQAAMLGDRIVPMVGETEDGWTVVALCSEDEKVYATVACRGRE